MKYRELGIRTLRDTPAQAGGFADGLLARAGYFTATGDCTPLGELAIAHLKELENLSTDFLGKIGLRYLAVPSLGSVYSVPRWRNRDAPVS